MSLFFELFTLAAFAACAVHAGRRHGARGVAFFVALATLGAVRETAVAAYEVLYGFAPLTLRIGPAPLIAAVIWGFSVYAAVTWAEVVGGRRLLGSAEPWRLSDYLAAALFMVALAGFYEPFLELVGMAKWEVGTRATAGVPWIALVGYPTLTLAFLALWRWSWRSFQSVGPRTAALAGGVVALAVAHAFGLKSLKDALGW